ncbi:hypothetical protein HAX54_005126, partial [Datura stramonium]|nr:hypothetical protein [Datura stramonium]
IQSCVRVEIKELFESVVIFEERSGHAKAVSPDLEGIHDKVLVQLVELGLTQAPPGFVAIPVL